MKTYMKILSMVLALLILTSCVGFANTMDVTQPESKQDNDQKDKQAEDGSKYSIEQAMSDNAQLTTIAFSGLAFITGSDGADTFFPPGKVADFFGFQYMRDIDEAGYGHNTTFLPKAANNILYILDDTQKQKLIDLALSQVDEYSDFAYNRFPLMDAFRRNLEGDLPAGATDLDFDRVAEYTGNLYKYDAVLSYERAVVLGEIIESFTDEQIAYLDGLAFNDSSTWYEEAEDEELKRSLSHDEHVGVMTYASELFSWYKGNVEADIYFCPERHGTYFGGFFMKDYHAMDNPDYFISTSVTGDSGREFIKILNDEQAELITSIIEEQKPYLEEIASIRTEVSNELRKAMKGETVNKDKVFSLIQRYGELDGYMSALYASRFAAVKSTLPTEQYDKLVELRNLTIVPDGAYKYSQEIEMPEVENTDYLFGIGQMPVDTGDFDSEGKFIVKNGKAN